MTALVAAFVLPKSSYLWPDYDRSYITVVPIQSAVDYTAGLRQKYITILILPGTYILLYVITWCVVWNMRKKGDASVVMSIDDLKIIYKNLLQPVFGEHFRIDDSDEEKNWVVIILDGEQEDFYFSLYGIDCVHLYWCNECFIFDKHRNNLVSSDTYDEIVFEGNFDIEQLPYLITDLVLLLKDCTYVTKEERIKGKIPSGYDDIKDYVITARTEKLKLPEYQFANITITCHPIQSAKQHWKAHYKDSLHDTNIEIINTEEDYITEPLSFTLDNITFCGTCLNGFHLADETQYDGARKKFSLIKWGGHSSKFHITSPYLYDLQRYELEVEIPVSVFRKRDEQLITGVLFLSFKYIEPDMSKPHCIRMCDDIRVYSDDVIVREFSLSIDGKCYKSAEKTLYFEAALKDICGQIKDNYYIKSCYTCQYSDYSPYGNDDYGLMLCFCRHKDDCLKVNSKEDFFSFLEGKDFDGRQETYLCEHYCLRDKASGYRGFIDGISFHLEMI